MPTPRRSSASHWLQYDQQSDQDPEDDEDDLEDDFEEDEDDSEDDDEEGEVWQVYRLLSTAYCLPSPA